LIGSSVSSAKRKIVTGEIFKKMEETGSLSKAHEFQDSLCEDSNGVNSGFDEEKSYGSEKLGLQDFELLRVVGHGILASCGSSLVPCMGTNLGGLFLSISRLLCVVL
jgi:hypothetical protein